MKLFNRKYHPPGTQPGLIIAPENGIFTLDLFEYSAKYFKQYLNADLTTCKTFIQSEHAKWIHVQGCPSREAMEAFAKNIGIHELYLEDVLNIGQRPRADVSDEHIFVILNLPVKTEESTKIEQVSLYLNKNMLVSFATGNVSPFARVIDRLKSCAGKLRKHQCDYLMYALIDTVIDYGFPLLENYSNHIQALEDTLLETRDTQALADIHKLRRELLLIRKRLWPQREVINELLRTDQNTLLSDLTLIHFRDCHDHVISILEMLETFHEMTSGLMELYLTSVSLKLNDVIKFLTIFTTIFIPPTFIAGVYGMNFSRAAGSLSMPELDWQYGYISVWALICIAVGGMLFFFGISDGCDQTSSSIKQRYQC